MCDDVCRFAKMLEDLASSVMVSLKLELLPNHAPSTLAFLMLLKVVAFAGLRGKPGNPLQTKAAPAIARGRDQAPM